MLFYSFLQLIDEYQRTKDFQKKADAIKKLKDFIRRANLQDEVDLTSSAVELYKILITKGFAPKP